ATYTKDAANGDTLFGQIIPDNPANPFTTGAITIDGGTGRFQGATGIEDYVVSSNAGTGAITVEITGFIAYDPQGGQETQALPLQTPGRGARPCRPAAHPRSDGAAPGNWHGHLPGPVHRRGDVYPGDVDHLPNRTGIRDVSGDLCVRGRQRGPAGH